MKNYENVKALLQQYVDNNEIAGADIIIREGGRLALMAGVGWQNEAKTIPVDEHTIYRLASMTKPVTAIAIMILSEEGKLDIQDPIGKYITEYVGTDKENIRIIHLLNHTCGLGMLMHPGMQQAMDLSDVKHDRLADRVARWKDLKPDFPAGTETGYSNNVGFELAGRIVEIVSGMELDQFFEERIFRPLGISDMTFTLNDEQTKRRSICFHGKIPEALLSDAPADLESYIDASIAGFFSGAAGLFGTAADYDRIVQMLADGGIFNGVRLLKEETVLQMHTPVNNLAPQPGVLWGLGMQVFGEPEKTGYYVHKGSYSWSGAYGTHFFIDPAADRTFVLMLNNDNLGGSMSYVSRAVEKAIWEA